jgi:alginate O-acetyltransferase complex protein AlgJ
MSLRAYQVLLVATFCALLCVPGFSMLSRSEPPKLFGVKPVAYQPFKTLTQWSADFEEYFVANLGHKRRMIQLNNWIGYRVLGDLQSDTVLVGKRDWLFLKQNFGWESMRSEQPLSRKDAATWRRVLQRAERQLSERDIPFLFVVVPSKETIYPEFLPKSAPRARSTSRFDEVLAVMKESGVQYLELRTPLIAGRQRAQLYDSIDSHWNGHGAHIGAELILQKAAELLKRPHSFAELDAHLSPRPSWGDMPVILSLDDVITVPSVELVPNRPRARRVEPPESVREPTRKQQTKMVYEVDDETLPKALILRDSFAEGFMPIFSEKFRRTVWLWTHDLDLRLVERERPDIVIVEMTERFLSDAPPKLQLPRDKP